MRARGRRRLSRSVRRIQSALTDFKKEDNVMLFKRRKPLTWLETFRVSVWPRRSWGRSWAYVSKRTLRLSATPHAIAAGVAAGAAISFTPLVGLHFVLSFIVCWFIRGNLIAGALGTFIGNPVTFPFIWLATYNLGMFMLGQEPALGTDIGIVAKDMGDIIRALLAFEGARAASSFAHIWPTLLYPMMIGGVILAPFIALVFYVPTRRACRIFRERRRSRMMRKAALHARPSARASGRAGRRASARAGGRSMANGR